MKDTEREFHQEALLKEREDRVIKHSRAMAFIDHQLAALNPTTEYEGAFGPIFVTRIKEEEPRVIGMTDLQDLIRSAMSAEQIDSDTTESVIATIEDALIHLEPES